MNATATENTASFALNGLTWRVEFSTKGLRQLSVHPGKGKTGRSPGFEFRERLEKVQDAVAARVSGRRADLNWKDFDLSGRAEFHLRVWKRMHEIPFGETRSYAEIAGEAGSPLAFRACGQACRANPIVLFIPCHRVIGSAGLGGFTPGVDWKKRFLAWEGIDWRQLGAKNAG